MLASTIRAWQTVFARHGLHADRLSGLLIAAEETYKTYKEYLICHLGRRQRVVDGGGLPPWRRPCPSPHAPVELLVYPGEQRQQLRDEQRTSTSSAALSGTLNGSGSTLQLTYQEAAISAFKTVQSGMTVNYGACGSGKGRTDLASGVANYAASDSPTRPRRKANFNGKTVLYFPDVIAPVTVSNNLSGLSKPLQLSAPVIASIFQAKITKWNDPAIAADNPGVTLPSTAITIAVRSDSRAPRRTSPSFSSMPTGDGWTLGTSSTIKWPATARAGSGNGGVASIIKSTPGAVGYVDYSDAKASGLTFASIKNKAGDYVAPSVAGASAAAASVTVKPDLTFSSIWAPGASSYPITAQSWVLVYETQPNANDAKKCSRRGSATWSETARNCSPIWVLRRCPPACSRWPKRRSAR